MKNSLRFTSIFGKIRYAEFDSIRYIRPIMVGTTEYYSIYVTGVVYTDTDDTVAAAHFGLYTHDYVIYRGKTYEFDNLDRLCMVVENENNLAVLEAL